MSVEDTATRRFRVWVFALIGLGILGAVAFKGYHIQSAFQNWEGQELGSTPGSAR
ncbi:MAG: hypothetical protein AAGC57_19330 [Pseudomonadota bacterium]